MLYEKQIFLKLLLHPNRFSIGKAISLSKFYNELKEAFASYRKSALAKSYYKRLDEDTLESDFYQDLQWNFNHLSNSVWYIKKL